MSNIREWSLDSHPKSSFVRLKRWRVAKPGTVRAVCDYVQVSEDGVDSWSDDADGETIGPNSGDTDVVLAAIFRQAGIVDALRMVVEAAKRSGDIVLADHAESIRKAFGEALS